jgi:CBS domain containing-hemolysin-like protein
LDSLTLIDGLVLFGFLSISAVLATAEFAFFSASRDELAGASDRRSGLLVRMLGKPQELLINLLVGTSISNVAAVFFALRISWRAFPSGTARTVASIVSLVIISVLLAILARLLPKIYVAHNPETAALNLARPVFVLLLPLYPLVKTVQLLTQGFFLAGTQARELLLKAGELRAMARADAEGESSGREEREMISGIFEMRDTTAREVMVPRIDMISAESSTTVAEAVKIIARGGHSRIPVYTKTVDNTIGVLHARDLFKFVADGGLETPISSVIRQAYFVPESKRVKELLSELRARKTHMAIVVDEFGGVVGLVTLEDVIEQIVGEIYDEHEVELKLYSVLGDDVVRVDGKVRIEELNEVLKTEIKKEEDYDTIAGFLYNLVGKVPSEGEEYEACGLKFLIEKVTGQRIEWVVIKGEGIGKAAREGGRQGQAVG